MAQHESYFTCDLCGNRFEKHDGVRNDVMITNGEHSRSYIDVCDRCIKKMAKLLDDNFPRNIKKHVDVPLVRATRSV